MEVQRSEGWRSAAAGGSSREAWYGRSGFAELDQRWVTVHGYARQIASYIADPSTVRVRVLERFGRAPTIEVIAAMRASHLAARAATEARFDLGEEGAALFDGAAALPEPEPIAAEPIAQQTDPPRSRKLWRDVIASVAAAHGLRADDITGPGRQHALFRVRALACAVLRARGASLPQIGRWLGGRDHSSLVYALRVWERRLCREGDLAATFAALRPEDFGDDGE